jgi:hypothetical protein
VPGAAIQRPEVEREHGALGWCWWVWRDYYMNEDSLHWGLVGLDRRFKSPEVAPATLDSRDQR